MCYLKTPWIQSLFKFKINLIVCSNIEHEEMHSSITCNNTATDDTKNMNWKYKQHTGKQTAGCQWHATMTEWLATWLRGELVNESWLQSLTDQNLYKHAERLIW